MYKIILASIATLSLLGAYGKSTSGAPKGCNLITLSACEVNSCPKQSVNGLPLASVCQISCSSLGSECDSWTFYKLEKVSLNHYISEDKILF